MKWFIKCLKQYADFEGRARRREYWWFAVFNALISMVLVIAMVVQMLMDIHNGPGFEDSDELDVIYALFSSPFFYIYVAFYLAMLIPGIAVLVRRLHDIGKSGFWAFFVYGGTVLSNVARVFSDTNIGAYLILGLTAMVILIISMVWLFTDSQQGPNKWGPNPKDEGNPSPEVPQEDPTTTTNPLCESN